MVTPPLKETMTDSRARGKLLDTGEDQNSTPVLDSTWSEEVTPRAGTYGKQPTSKPEESWERPQPLFWRDANRLVSYFDFDVPEHLGF